MKILVIDDESLVRDSVVKGLHNLGIRDIEEAVDGIQALNNIHTFRPDLIIADIMMPRMTGIDLLAKLKEQNDETLFVLLSGYDLFEYAQTALNLGAFSYLLKPVSINSEKYLQHKIQELDIRFDYNTFCVLSISLDRYNVLHSSLSPNEVALIKYGIENIACEILMNHGISAFSFDTEDGQGLLVNFPSEHIENDFSALIKTCLEVKDSIANFLRHEVTIGVGALTTSFLDLPDSYEASRKALVQRLIKGGHTVIHVENPEIQREKFKVLSFRTEQEMLSSFEKCEQEAAMYIIKELYTPFFSFDFVDRSSLLKLNFQLILLIYKILERLDVNPMEILGEELALYEEVNQCSHIGEIIGWFHDTLTISFEAVLHTREKGNKKIVEKARHYIHENYQNDLSLESVADHIHISATYFSSIFKKEMNENFVDYVSNYRIERAKELLKDGIYKVNTISSMVGFSNVKYFYKVFKKRTGFKPSEYKEI